MANDLGELMSRGQLRIGDTLYHPKRANAGGGEITAKVVVAGIEVNGRVYRSVSTAAGAVAGHSVNGWKYWRLRPSGMTLAALRTTSGS